MAHTHTRMFLLFTLEGPVFTFFLKWWKSEKNWSATRQKDWYSDSVHRAKTSAHPVSHPTVKRDQLSSGRRSGPLDWKNQNGPVLTPFMTWTNKFWTKNRHGTWRLIIGGVLEAEFHWFPTVLKVGRQFFKKNSLLKTKTNYKNLIT
jgi:hypothetical protein